MTVVHPQTETRVEYAVRYTSPAVYAGIVGTICGDRAAVEDVARREEQHPGAEFRCTVVRRTVTYGDWEPAG